MKILVLSDIHSQVEKLAEIRQNIPTEVDTALILGDLTNYGDKHPKEIIDIIGLEKFYAIPGNLDDWRTLDELEELGVSIHGKKVRFGEVTLIGFGGGLEGHTGRILNNEEKIYTTLENILEGEEHVILATHLPPKDTSIDLGYNNEHLGSSAVRRIIEKYSPSIHLCGHIHNAKGETKIGNTLSINIGPAKEGNALLLDIGKEINFKRIEV